MVCSNVLLSIMLRDFFILPDPCKNIKEVKGDGDQLDILKNPETRAFFIVSLCFKMIYRWYLE